MEPTTPDHDPSSTCGYAFDRDHLEAVWLEYQEQGEVHCPETGATLELSLDEDPASSDAEVAEIRVRCPRCGRSAGFRPDSIGTVAWSE